MWAIPTQPSLCRTHLIHTRGRSPRGLAAPSGRVLAREHCSLSVQQTAHDAVPLPKGDGRPDCSLVCPPRDPAAVPASSSSSGGQVPTRPSDGADTRSWKAAAWLQAVAFLNGCSPHPIFFTWSCFRLLWQNQPRWLMSAEVTALADHSQTVKTNL